MYDSLTEVHFNRKFIQTISSIFIQMQVNLHSTVYIPVAGLQGGDCLPEISLTCLDDGLNAMVRDVHLLSLNDHLQTRL